MMPALGMTMAQAGHDTAGRAGPNTPPLCSFCDGDRVVEVAAVKNRDGRVSDYPDDIAPAETACPHCVGGSEERV